MVKKLGDDVMRKTAILKDDLFLEHIPNFNHVESPDRLAVIYNELGQKDIKDNFLFPTFSPAPEQMLLMNHSQTHVNRVASTSGKTFDSLDPDTQTSAQSYNAACLAAGAVVKGVEMLAAGEADNCFALVRPPGHHAEADRSMGFCLFNNVAIGAHYALSQLGMGRIFILDWDLHHGNGTQNSFYDTDQVFYFSSHQYPYYPGSGGLAETGTGRGKGFTLNVPLSGGQNDRAYGQILREIVVPVAQQYKPDIIIVSAGFDIFHGDPLGTMAVSGRGFGYMTKILVDLAEEICGGHLLIALEGGYNLEGLRDGVLSVLGELADIENVSDDRLNRHSENNIRELESQPVYLPVIDQVREVAKKYWNL